MVTTVLVGRSTTSLETAGIVDIVVDREDTSIGQIGEQFTGEVRYFVLLLG